MEIHKIIDKINDNKENKILFAIYEDKINLSLNYLQRTTSEEELKLYGFLKLYLKQMEKALDEIFDDMYFVKEDLE